MSRLLRPLLLPALLLAAVSAAAQPANDFRYAAYSIVQAGTYTGTNVGATTSELPGNGDLAPSCMTAGHSAPNSVWWRFEPSASGTITIDLSNSGFDTVLSVYSSLEGVEVACDDDSGTSTTSSATFSVLGGYRYLVRVAGYDGASGPISMAVSPTSLIATSPDDAAADGFLMPADGLYPSSIVGATNEPALNPAASCVSAANDGGNSVWRSLEATANGTVTISTAGSNFDTIMSVYIINFAPTTLDEVGCNDDTNGASDRTSTVTFNVFAGMLYVVRVVGYQGASGSLLQYTVSGLAPPLVDAEPPAAPAAVTALAAPVPNPTAGATTLRATLATAADVDLAVYDLLGRRVATLASGPHPAGALDAAWDASTVPPGIYLARLTADGTVSTQRITVAR